MTVFLRFWCTLMVFNKLDTQKEHCSFAVRIPAFLLLFKKPNYISKHYRKCHKISLNQNTFHLNLLFAHCPPPLNVRRLQPFYRHRQYGHAQSSLITLLLRTETLRQKGFHGLSMYGSHRFRRNLPCMLLLPATGRTLPN